MIIHRKINIDIDREALLEFHCEINYECESAVAKEMSYEIYRKKWLDAKDQVEEFISALLDSTKDHNTIADILVDEKGTTLGYLWAIFYNIKDYNLCIAEIREIAVSKKSRNSGIGKYAIEYIEKIAKLKGANIIRSGTSVGNTASRAIHDRYGFKPYRIEYEKVLD